MVTSQLGALLKEFESFFNCPLNPDDNNSCLIQLGSGVTLQIELDRYGLLLVGCRLGVVHMGRYRNDLIRAALKSNELSSPSTGVFGFSQKSNQLILFIKFDPHLLTIHQITTVMPPFMEKAKKWMDAISKGEVPLMDSESTVKASGLFGLIS